MTDKLFLIILYNKSFDSSHTLRSLQLNQHLLISSHLFVWDNSKCSAVTITELKSKFSNIDGVYLTHTPENWALSKIYNHIITTEQTNYKYLILLDDDTKINESYLTEINTLTANKNTSKLFLPKIISNNILVSPARLYYFVGRYLPNIKHGLMPSKNLAAINSGMIISFKYFDEFKFRYDENLKFYCTDNDFMIAYRKNMAECYIMETVLKHSLSQFDITESIEKKAYRFTQNLKGLLYLNNHNLVIYIFACIYVTLKSITTAIKFGSFKFIYYLWKN